MVDVVSLNAVPTLTDHRRFTPTNSESGRLLDDLIDFLQCLHQLVVVVAPDLVLGHQVPVDVVQLGGPLPETLDVAHDPGVLAPHHEGPDDATVVGHVGTEPLSDGLQLLRLTQQLLQLGDLGGEVAVGGEVLHAEVGAETLDEVPGQLHVVSPDGDRAVLVHVELEGTVVPQREELQLQAGPALQLLSEEEVLVEPHDDPLDPFSCDHGDLAGRGLRGCGHQGEH